MVVHKGSPHDYDVAVVGGGPGGLASALCLARRGWRVAVFEKRRWPVDKACGEGIMPTGLSVLRGLGVVPAGAPFYGISYQVEEKGGPCAQARFNEGPGLAVRRTELSTQLFERCQKVPNITLFEESPAQVLAFAADGVRIESPKSGELRVSLVIGADGLHSSLRTWVANRPRALPGLISRFTQGLGRWRRSSAQPRRHYWRWGLRRHFLCSPWSDLVEVHLAEGCEAYVSPAALDLVGVAILCRRDLVEIGFDSLLARFPSLVARLGSAPFASSVRSVGPLEQPSVGLGRDGLILLGDAAGYVDASTGEGLSLAFGQAEKLAQLLGPPKAQGGLIRLPWRYRLWVFGQHLPYRATTYLTLWLGERPQLRAWVVRLLSRWPGLFRWLLSLNMGTIF